MRKSQSASSATVVIVTSIFATTLASAADTFRKLNDSEIRSKVSGMEIVDVEDHWAEQYMRDGSPCQGFSNCAASALFAADLHVTLFATSHPSK